MPELPDVEGFRRLLQRHASGETVTRVDVRDAGVVRALSGQEFMSRLEGRRFRVPERRGKWLLAPTDGPTVLFHFGMTGHLRWRNSHDQPGPFERVIIGVGAGHLVFEDQRKLRGLWLAEGEDEVRTVIGKQGPDALEIAPEQLDERLRDHRGSLKAVLMDQSVLAGLGNMLTDEVLWRARIHPKRQFADLDRNEREQLGRCLQRILRASVEAGQIPRRRRWLSSQRSRPKPRCPRCRTGLMTSRIGGRTSYWCPNCQPLGPGG